MSSPVSRKRPIGQEIWNHYRWVRTGRRYVDVHDPFEAEQEETRLEEHWGRKEVCAKCRKDRNNIGEWKNDLTWLGYFLVGAMAVALVFVAVILSLVL